MATQCADHVPSSRVVRGRSVVVAAAPDSVAHSSRDHQYQADNEEDEPDDPQDVELEQESCHEKDDSENDHDVYLVSLFDWVCAEILGTGGQCLKASFSLAPACLVLPLNWWTRPSVFMRRTDELQWSVAAAGLANQE